MRALGLADLLGLTCSRISVGSLLLNSPGTSSDLSVLLPLSLAAELPRFWETSEIYHEEFCSTGQILSAYYGLSSPSSFC